MSIYYNEIRIDENVKIPLQEFINRLNYALQEAGEGAFISIIKGDSSPWVIIESNDPLTRAMFPEGEKKK